MPLQSNLIHESPWYVIYTIHKNEKKIYKELIKQNVNAFLPLQKVVRQWKQRKKNLEVPLFPNYIFVKIPQNRTWSILSIYGVIRFLTYNGSLAVIRDTDIDVIKSLLLNDGEIINPECYNTGEEVRVKQGPFAGLKGIVLNIKGKDRFIVEFETINKAFAIDIPAFDLEKIAVA